MAEAGEDDGNARRTLQARGYARVLTWSDNHLAVTCPTLLSRTPPTA